MMSKKLSIVIAAAFVLAGAASARAEEAAEEAKPFAIYLPFCNEFSPRIVSQAAN